MTRLPLTLIATALVLAAPAHAGSISPSLAACSGSLTGLLPGATACAQVTPLTGKLNDNLGLVNTLGFFGISDWLFDGKWDKGNDSSSLFDFSGNSLAGSYSYTGGSGIADILMLFKSGAGTNLVGYLVTAATGSYVSPFLPGAFPVRNTKDISHISVYYRPGSTSPGSNPGTGNNASGTGGETAGDSGTVSAGAPQDDPLPILGGDLGSPTLGWTRHPGTRTLSRMTRCQATRTVASPTRSRRQAYCCSWPPGCSG